MRKAVFLDRDGVIIKEKGFVTDYEQVEIFDFAASSIKILNEMGFVVIVITNQPQVARGLCTEDDVRKINAKITETLENDGARIDAFYFCPHHPDKGFPEENPAYKIKCYCRKPETGMVDKAAKNFGINLSESYIIGDQTRDIETGKNIKSKYPGFVTILVKTGYGGNDNKFKAVPDAVAEDLLDAVQIIKKMEEGE